MRYLLPMLLYIGLTAYALADIIQQREDEPFRLHRVLWILIVVFLPWVGAIVWLLVRYTSGGSSSGYDSRQRQPMLAPDDDPDYLIWLREQERRRHQDGERP